MDQNFLTILIIIGSIFLCLIFYVFNQTILLEILIVISLVILFIMTGKHFMSTNTTLSNVFGQTSTVDIVVDPNGDLPPDSSGNTPSGNTSGTAYFIPGEYTYDEAVQVCQKDNASLATIGQLYDAYNKGKEWCQYGWSDEMMALYPTQTSTWEMLKTQGKKSCGRPGVNGGYTNNSKAKLGANCYK
jgi:Extracellular link domain